MEEINKNNEINEALAKFEEDKTKEDKIRAEIINKENKSKTPKFLLAIVDFFKKIC